MNTFTVYEHINRTNGKRYVGITERRPEDRWGTDGYNYRHSSPRFWSAIQKYGWNGFNHIIVARGLTKDEACAMEIRRIKQFDSVANGYNMASGGEHPEMSEESCAKISKAMMGNKNGLGKPCSPEKAKKIGDSQRGRSFSLLHRKRISDAKKGKPHASPSEATRRKISQGHLKRPVYCEETEKFYESVQACARELHVDPTNVSAMCKGKLKHVDGYHLEYALDHVIKA